jgi:hypothetical protein
VRFPASPSNAPGFFLKKRASVVKKSISQGNFLDYEGNENLLETRSPGIREKTVRLRSQRNPNR